MTLVRNMVSCIQMALLYISYHASKKTGGLVIIGVTEIANLLYNMKQLFDNESIVVCKVKNKFYEKNVYDMDLSKNNRIVNLVMAPIIFGKLAKNSRVFIYLWSDSFLLDREHDFAFLKKHRIPVICIFSGSEIRSRKLLLEYCKKINFSTYVEYDKPDLFLSDRYDCFNRTLAEQADKYASIIFSHKIDQVSYLKSEQYHFPVLINNDLFSFDKSKFDQVPIRILHSPSLPVLKGTPLVRSVIKMLKNEGYLFQYIELINLPNEDVVNELKQSHIVLNQFYTFVPGIFGHEAMATGNAVLMSAKPDCYPYPFNNAWLETEDWQLYYNLKFLLDHPEKIIEYAESGYEYMLQNFSTNAIREYLSGVFEKNGLSF